MSSQNRFFKNPRGLFIRRRGESLGIFAVLMDAGGIRIWRRKAQGRQGPPQGLIDPIFYINIL